MERLERRAIGRVAFPSSAVIVICDTQKVLNVDVIDIGPIGVGVKVPSDTPNLVGKDIILVAETLIMYADVVRQTQLEDGSYAVGVAARKFTNDVLEYISDGLKLKADASAQ